MIYFHDSTQSDVGKYGPRSRKIFGDRTIVGEQLDVGRVSISGQTLRVGDVALELSRENNSIMLYVNVDGEHVFEKGPFQDEPAGLEAYGEFKANMRGSRIEITDGRLSVIAIGEKPKR